MMRRPDQSTGSVPTFFLRPSVFLRRVATPALAVRSDGCGIERGQHMREAWMGRARLRQVVITCGILLAAMFAAGALRSSHAAGAGPFSVVVTNTSGAATDVVNLE